VARWLKGEKTVQFLLDRGRLETFESSDLARLGRRYRSIRQADLRTVQAYASYGAVFRPVGRADHQTRRRMGSREGNGSASRSAGTAVSHAAGAVQLINTEREF
jgi:hypothetical protein